MEAEDYPQQELNRQDQFLEKGVKLNDGHHIQIIPSGKKVLYIFKDDIGNDTGKYTHEEPLTITPLSTIGKEIKKHLDPDGLLSAAGVGREFEKVKQALNDAHQLYQIREENLKKVEAEESEEQLQERMLEAEQVLKCKNLPLIYIASLVSWLTAGERVNIMLAFMCYCSQVIMRNPISVIAIGDGGSGKTHIEETALSMIPEEFKVYEKKVTEAAMFNRSKDDQYFYNGKIVIYGDLGGDDDQKDVIAAKNMLKELQSDGYLNKPLSIQTNDEGWVTQDITLKGYPCLTYTTVPGFMFDDQEKSRSIFITPRMDNKGVFNARKTILEFKGGKTYLEMEGYKKDIEIVKYMVLLLRKRMESLEIINPYTYSVITFLGESEYFKRDFDKYNGILKTITAFNSFDRETFEMNGKEVVFTSLDDLQLFISLLISYHESITGNITLKAAEILEDIRANFDDWILRNKVFELGLTTAQYADLTNLHVSKRSIQRYFGELNSAGFLKVVDKQGNSNIYALTGRVTSDELSNLLNLSLEQKELIKYEIGYTALEFIECDLAHDKLSIKLNDPDVKEPPWEIYDK